MELKIAPLDSFFLNFPLEKSPCFSGSAQQIFCVLLSAAAGWIAWDTFIPASLLIPVIWTKADTKKTAWLIGLAYHLAASRGLIIAAPVFFGSGVFYGLGLWFLAGLLQSSPYFLCAFVRNSYLRVLLLFTVLIFPPVGIVAWANPLTAAGLIFPGFGFKGLLLTICLVWLMIWQIDKSKIALSLTVGFIFFCPLYLNSETSSSIQNIKGVETKFSGNPKHLGDKFSRDYKKFRSTYGQFSESKFKTLVLPESTAGIWFDSTINLWGRWQRYLKKDQSVVLSTLLPENESSLKTYNALVLMTKAEFKVLYKARQSVPIGMWKPWAKDNVKINWFGSPGFEINDKKATALICYEAYLTWPVLQSFLTNEPETILFVSNHWWSKNTSLLSIQKTCANAWASLFGVELVTAINQ